MIFKFDTVWLKKLRENQIPSLKPLMKLEHGKKSEKDRKSIAILYGKVWFSTLWPWP